MILADLRAEGPARICTLVAWQFHGCHVAVVICIGAPPVPTKDDVFKNYRHACDFKK